MSAKWGEGWPTVFKERGNMYPISYQISGGGSQTAEQHNRAYRKSFKSGYNGFSAARLYGLWAARRHQG